MSVSELVESLARAHVAVVVVTAVGNDPARRGEYLSRGARVVLPLSAPLPALLAVVRRIEEGLSVIAEDERERCLAAYRAEDKTLQGMRDRVDRLSAGETEVLGYLMRGTNVREVAKARVVSEATVRTQVKSILAKLEVSSQVAASAIGHRVAADRSRLSQAS